MLKLPLRIYKVRGNSLSPAYQDGDFVLCGRLHHPAVGQVIVFDLPGYGRLIKRIESIEVDGSLVVRGDDIDSVDSRTFGPIDPAMVRDRVVWHIAKGKAPRAA